MHKGFDSFLDIMLLVFCMVICIVFYRTTSKTLREEVMDFKVQDKSTVGGTFNEDIKTYTPTTDDLVLTIIVNDKMQPSVDYVQVDDEKVRLSEMFYQEKELYLQTLWNKGLGSKLGHEIDDITYRYDGGEKRWQYKLK